MWVEGTDRNSELPQDSPVTTSYLLDKCYSEFPARAWDLYKNCWWSLQETTFSRNTDGWWELQWLLMAFWKILLPGTRENVLLTRYQQHIPAADPSGLCGSHTVFNKLWISFINSSWIMLNNAVCFSLGSINETFSCREDVRVRFLWPGRSKVHVWCKTAWKKWSFRFFFFFISV